MARLKLKIHESPVCYENTDTPCLKVSIVEMDETLRRGTAITAPNGMVFQSVSCPEWYTYGAGGLYLRGSARDCDNSTFNVPLAKMEALITAVRWLNTTYATVSPEVAKLKAFAAELRTLADKYSK